MLNSSTLQSENLLKSSSLISLDEKPLKLPRKISECQTSVSSSFSSRGSFCHPNFDECNLDLNSRSLSELSLLQLFSNQSYLPISYEQTPKSKEMNFYFDSRIKILQWIEEVLNSASISVENKNSIYHRFSYAYMIITGKLKEKNVFYTNLKFKILIVTIFLFCYKLEGFVVNRLLINTIIQTFLSSVPIEESELNLMIREMEVEICSLINYEIFLIESNIYQTTQLLFHAISEKIFYNDEDLKEAIYFTLEQTNYEIENSNDSNILFDLFPIEKGIVSLISSIMIVVPEKIDQCIDYFMSDLNVCHFSKQQLVDYCEIYVEKINKEEE